MNKMERLQRVNETIRTLEEDSLMLGKLCGQIRDYVNEEKFLPTELQEKTIDQLQSMKRAQNSCRNGFIALTGETDLPETYMEAEDRMERQREFFCKEEILQIANRFKNLVADSPAEAAALREEQEKVVIADPKDMSLQSCQERYRPYIDFVSTLDEEDAVSRIGYVRKLEDYFAPSLIAGAVIIRNIHDPEKGARPFLDENCAGSVKEEAAPAVVPEVKAEPAPAEIEEPAEEPYAEPYVRSVPAEYEEVPAAAEEAAAETEAAELEAAEPEAEAAIVETAKPEAEMEEAAEEAVEEKVEEPAAEEIESKDYLADFDEDYIEYYQMAKGEGEEAAESNLAKWPEEGEAFGTEGVRGVLSSIGFDVREVEDMDLIRGKYENYRVFLNEGSSADDADLSDRVRSLFEEGAREGFRVVCLYGQFNGEELSRAFREIGNRHHTLILFQNPVTQGVRRSLVRLVRREGLRKVFAVLDRVAYEYIDRNYSKENVSRMFLDIIMPGPNKE